MQLHSIDLNLLVVFQAVYQEKSLTRAGARLNCTASAVSHALARLRASLDDPLFIRQGNSMEPTAMAERMYADCAPALDKLMRTLYASDAFNPATAPRAFTLGLNDYVASVLLPPLLRRLAVEAPSVRLVIRPSNYEHREALLIDGALDLLLGCNQKYGATIHREFLFADRDVCIVRSDHPRIGDTLSYEAYLAAPCIALSLSDSGADAIASYLDQKGLKRNVAHTVSQELTLPGLVAGSDFIANLAGRVASDFARRLPLRILPVPLPQTDFAIYQYWHASQERDPAHQWLRRVIQDIAASLPDPDSDTPGKAPATDVAPGRNDVADIP